MRDALQPGAEHPEPRQSGSGRLQPQSQPSSVPYQIEEQVQPAGAPPVPPVPVPPVPVPRQLLSAVVWLSQLDVVALPTKLQVNVAVWRQLSHALNWLLQAVPERVPRLWQLLTQLDKVSFAHAAAITRVHIGVQAVPPVPVPPAPVDPPLPLETTQLSSTDICEVQFDVVASPLESQV